jgi:starvation-inducible DNA-binding protein
MDKVNMTSDNLADGTRRVLIKLCNDRLADAVDLQLQCKHAYWNTTESDLMPLRKLFDELNELVEDYIDRIAERAVQLGGVADSTGRVVATWSHVLCSPDANCRNHAQTIATALASSSERVRQTIETSKDLGDVASAHLFTAISEDISKWHQKMTAF